MMLLLGDVPNIILPTSHHQLLTKTSDPTDVDITVETEAHCGPLLVISFSENLNTSPENLKLRGLKMKAMP